MKLVAVCLGIITFGGPFGKAIHRDVFGKSECRICALTGFSGFVKRGFFGDEDVTGRNPGGTFLNGSGRADRVRPNGAAVTETVYKICDSQLWRDSERAGSFNGAPIDQRDGYIHFSTATQAGETAARHFAGVADLVLVAVDAPALGDALRWEPSRGGDLFPHLYGALPLSAVRWVKPLRLGADGQHVFPELIA